MNQSANEIQVTSLNSTCLSILLKYSRLVKASAGLEVSLRDENLVSWVYAHAEQSSDPELRSLANRLHHEMVSYLKDCDKHAAQLKHYQPLAQATTRIAA
ncbi:hypothetical protein [Arenicella xantha]|uniref:Uncharacterized protein n=1 Tax=Arenicella xantha TaxID=644221 RepID=A0A395JM50_9GAMM|nr:hypothetical protein [Arenicella xantha]RBP52690.1 hypothetical protein DFR28_10172 [Arenicella xantha]